VGAGVGAGVETDVGFAAVAAAGAGGVVTLPVGADTGIFLISVLAIGCAVG
jgi:hypothetical protein